MKSVWTFRSVINAPFNEVQELFFDLREGDFSEFTAPILVSGKGSVSIKFDKIAYTVRFADSHLEFIIPEREENRIAVQGEWWYRGEYFLSAEGNSTRIQLEIFNLADHEWMVSLMNIGAKRKHELAFLSLCKMAERKIA